MSREYCGKLRPLREGVRKLEELVGATIVGVGMTAAKLEGGLAIDYSKNGSKTKRVVLGYTELGEWVEYIGPAERR